MRLFFISLLCATIISLTVDLDFPSAMRKLQYEDVYSDSSSSDDDDVPLDRLMKKSKDFNEIMSESLLDAAPFQPKENDFVVVKFTNKKLFVSHYVGGSR